MNLSRSSMLAADPLSDALGVLGAECIRRTRLEAAGAWALAFPAKKRLKLVALRRGRCWILLPDQPPRLLTTGDVFLIGNTRYTMASRPEVPAIDGTALYAENRSDVARLGGEETELLGGEIAFAGEDPSFLLDALPVFLGMEGASPSAAAVTRMLDLLDAEVGCKRMGARLVASRLGEVLLVEAIRAFVADQGESCVGWIGALGDRHIGEALRLMHGEVDRPWTVATLAARVGMSRSAFSLHFARRVGRPPLDYLTRWRMMLARRRLREGRSDVASVSLEVGYTSQSAFSQAFKRTFGHSPKHSL